MFADDSPRAAEILTKNTYVDDILSSMTCEKEEVLKVAQEVGDMLRKGGFHVKFWQLSGESFTRKGDEVQNVVSSKDNIVPLGDSADDSTSRVLGVAWDPVEDNLVYRVSLNFCRKKKGVHTGPNLQLADLPKMIPAVLTKRMVLSQIMRIFDPLGKTRLQAKIMYPGTSMYISFDNL